MKRRRRNIGVVESVLFGLLFGMVMGSVFYLVTDRGDVGGVVGLLIGVSCAILFPLVLRG